MIFRGLPIPPAHHRAITWQRLHTNALLPLTVLIIMRSFPFIVAGWASNKKTIILPNQATSYGKKLAKVRQKPFKHVQPLQPTHLFSTDRDTAKDAHTGILHLDFARRR